MSAPAEPPPVRASAPGTQPEGVADERAAAVYVRTMFSRIAPRYDLLNHLLSLNLDRVWRRRAARRFQHILVRPEARVLDLCCGTGDLTLALHREASAAILGSDFAHPMLVRAREKSAATRVRYFEADALRLPCADRSMDLVTAAFGFRNLANYEAGLREIHRVLRPGGEVGILEFAAPQSGLLGALYRMYFTQVLPRVGGAVSGNREAYSYLPASVAKFPEPEELQAKMRAMGFGDPQSERWTFGIVALHRARKM